VRDKYQPSAHMTGTPLGSKFASTSTHRSITSSNHPLIAFGTVEHEIHRKRRAAISAFFSKRAVNDIEPWIHERTTTLCATVRHQQERDGSVELRVNFLAFTTDMIAAHALNGSNPSNTLHLLQNEENAKEWQKTIAAVALLTGIVKQFPSLIPVALKLSVEYWMTIAPPLGRIVRLNRVS